MYSYEYKSYDREIALNLRTHLSIIDPIAVGRFPYIRDDTFAGYGVFPRDLFLCVGLTYFSK